MKKAMLMVLMLLVGLAASPAFADRGDDYKVIQGARQAEKSAGQVTWFRLQVNENGKPVVNIRIPFSIVEMISECEKDVVSLAGHAAGEVKAALADKKKRCDVDLKRMLAELKKAGPTALIEINDGSDLVKIWLE